MISSFIHLMQQGCSVGTSMTNKGSDDPVQSFVENTGNSFKDVIDNTSSSVDQFAKDTGSSWKDVIANDSTGLLKPITTAAAGWFGGPWGAAAMSTANSRASGQDWGQSAANAGMSYAATDYAQGQGYGSGGDKSLVNIYEGGTPGVSEVGGPMMAPDVQQGTLDGLGGMYSTGGTDAAVGGAVGGSMEGAGASIDTGASGSMTQDVSTGGPFQQNTDTTSWEGIKNAYPTPTGISGYDISGNSNINPMINGETMTPQVGMGNASNLYGGQEPNLFDKIGYAFNNAKDTVSGMLPDKTTMNNGFQTYGKMKAIGNLYGAYQAQQRQGMLQDLYNQQKQAYDSQMGNYNNFNNQIQNLQTNPSEYFNSPEWQAQNSNFLANLARKDAASGRRSQYGARAAQMQNNFLQGVNAKTSALTNARGSAPSAAGLNQALYNQTANSNAIGQNIAGAGMNYFSPQISSLMDLF